MSTTTMSDDIDTTDPTLADFKIGQRVELHPGTNRWMMGDRLGTVTEVNAKAMINEVDICEVTANAEHTPSTCKVIGLLSTSGSNKIFLVSLSMIKPPNRWF